jgi:hypothetical protein
MVYNHAVHFDQQVNQHVESLFRIVIVEKKHVVQLHIASVFSITGQVPEALSYPQLSADGPVELSVFDAVYSRLAFGVVLPKQRHGIFTLYDLLLSHVNFFQSWHRRSLHKRTAAFIVNCQLSIDNRKSAMGNF